MHSAFRTMADTITARARGDERIQLYASGEISSFIRYNHAAVRQAGEVRHYRVTLRLIHNGRHAAMQIDLPGDGGDADRVAPLLDDLRQVVSILPVDPHLMLPDGVRSSESVSQSDLPPAAEISQALLEAAADTDFVGILSSGSIIRGFADSSGQRNWFSRRSVALRASLYAHTDKAEKVDWAGTHFDAPAVTAKIRRATERLPLLNRPEKSLSPGEYRAYLTPEALAEIVHLAANGCFAKASVAQGYCPLLQMHQGAKALSSQVHLVEDTAGGLAPTFDAWGFTKPDQVELVRSGRSAGLLVNSRSAAEYGTPTTGSNAHESAESIALAAGSLPEDQALKALGTGLYVSNLHYLNFSDHSAARMTGLTRFATHWVEDGEIVGPLQVMRFDDDLYRMLGTQLEALTDTVELVPHPYDYDGRSTTSYRCPGALLSGFNLAG